MATDNQMTANGQPLGAATGATPAPVPAADVRRRGGAPPGNTNRASHGLYGVGLPSGCQRVGRRLNEFRRSLCQAVECVAGEITLVAAASIDSACHWQRHLLLAARWLRMQHDELSPTERLSFSREIARAASERDKAIERLRLERDPQSEIEAFYAQLRSGALDAPPPDDDAAESDVGDDKGTGGHTA